MLCLNTIFFKQVLFSPRGHKNTIKQNDLRFKNGCVSGSQIFFIFFLTLTINMCALRIDPQCQHTSEDQQSTVTLVLLRPANQISQCQTSPLHSRISRLHHAGNGTEKFQSRDNIMPTSCLSALQTISWFQVSIWQRQACCPFEETRQEDWELTIIVAEGEDGRGQSWY